jgi:haloalkane dehalogenase
MCKSYLTDFPFSNRFTEINGIQIHYIDEGDCKSPVILFLHGVPTWSYTFRNIFPVCLSSGYRIVAPDLPGFGMSDKPGNPQNYTLHNLSGWLSDFIINLKLDKVCIFGHDWGVILGMILAAKYPADFFGFIACNGFLPVIPARAPLSFHLWRLFTRFSPFLPVGEIVNLGCHRKLTRDEKNGYDYPFLKNKNKIAVRILPGSIPLDDNNSGADTIKTTWEEMGKWHKPFLTVFSDSDPITRDGQLILQERIPGTKNQPGRILQGSHFLQEDAPLEIGKIINEFVKMNS